MWTATCSRHSSGSMWSTKTTMMFSTSWEHETLFRSVLVRLDHSAKISARGRREPPEATGRNRKSGVGTHLGVVRWYGFASAWHPSAPVERFGPKTATPPKMAQPSLHRHPPVVRLRHRRRRNAFDETARETRRNPMALAVGGGQALSIEAVAQFEPALFGLLYESVEEDQGLSIAKCLVSSGVWSGVTS